MSKSYREKFCVLFWKALAEGYSCNDARDYASLELTGRTFHA